MNEYKITVRLPDNTDYEHRVIEKSEAAARVALRRAHKGEKFEITGVELHRENVGATKQQERDALEEIKKIVSNLGPQSYIATAFEGCFEIAESNIDNDFGESMADKYRRATFAEDQLRDEVRKLREELEGARQEIADLKNKILDELLEEDLKNLHFMTETKLDEVRAKVKALEATILENAEHPETADFAQAVRDRKALLEDITYFKGLSRRIVRIINPEA